MAETQKITTLYVVTDSETSYDNIGDIDGGMFDDTWLYNHIKSHGASGLYEKLAFMSRQIVDAAIKVNNDKNDGEVLCANLGSYPTV